MYTFIVNPNAKSGLGARVWKDLENTLKEKQVPYQVYFTKYQNHAMKIAMEVSAAQDITQENCVIAILGGDGTINEVVNGISDFSKITLAYIPIGSSNDFSRSIGFTADPKEALERILSPKEYAKVDIGLLNYDGKRRRFMVSCGLGFDAEVCHRIVDSRLKPLLNRIGLGKLSYLGVALQSLFLQRPGKMTLLLDDANEISFDKVYFAAVMNQPYEGGGFFFCPKARWEDGKLDIIAAEGLSKGKVLCLLPTAFFGKHTRFRGIHIYQCHRVELQSEVPLPVHVDGEPVIAQKQIAIGLEPEKARFIFR